MKQLYAFGLLTIVLLLSSCEIVGGIFKAGMGFGIFLVIAVIILIVYLVMKIGGGGKK